MMTFGHKTYRLKPGEALTINTDKGDMLCGSHVEQIAGGEFVVVMHVLERVDDMAPVHAGQTVVEKPN